MRWWQRQLPRPNWPTRPRGCTQSISWSAASCGFFRRWPSSTGWFGQIPANSDEWRDKCNNMQGKTRKRGLPRLGVLTQRIEAVCLCRSDRAAFAAALLHRLAPGAAETATCKHFLRLGGSHLEKSAAAIRRNLPICDLERRVAVQVMFSSLPLFAITVVTPESIVLT